MTANPRSLLFVPALVALFGPLPLVTGCSPSPRYADVRVTSGAPLDPCDGIPFDADDPDPRCLRHTPSAPAPPAEAIALSIRGETVVRTGEAASVVVELRNTSDAPVTLDVDTECAFDAVARGGEGGDDCVRPCARGVEPRIVHVRLEPEGVVVKRARFYAVDVRTLEDHDRCATRTLGVLLPGAYTARVHVWPAADRVVDAPVQVLP